MGHALGPLPRMKEELLPGLDNALSGLLIDLDDRGMLDETLVVCLSEHGRTPRIQNVTGGGRDHWAQVYSVVMAGAASPEARSLASLTRLAAPWRNVPFRPKTFWPPSTTCWVSTLKPLCSTAQAGLPHLWQADISSPTLWPDPRSRLIPGRVPWQHGATSTGNRFHGYSTYANSHRLVPGFLPTHCVSRCGCCNRFESRLALAGARTALNSLYASRPENASI